MKIILPSKIKGFLYIFDNDQIIDSKPYMTIKSSEYERDILVTKEYIEKCFNNGDRIVNIYNIGSLHSSDPLLKRIIDENLVGLPKRIDNISMLFVVNRNDIQI